MAGQSGAAKGGPSSEDEVRAWIAAQIRFPNRLTPHGATAFGEEAVGRVDDLSRELELKAAELRAKRLPPELTEESVVEAVARLEEKQRQGVLRVAAELTARDRADASRRGRRRRRWAVALAMFGSAGLGSATLAGAWAPPVAAVLLLLVLASAILTLTGGE
jgi:uncharacterized membrane protein YphA (DoxX/SURF4 family)